MIFILFLAALVSADPCSDFAASRNIRGSGTFAKGPVCHALFWEVARGSGAICVYTSANKDTCPTTFAVLVAEAESFLAGGAAAEPITTTTTRVPVDNSRRALIPSPNFARSHRSVSFTLSHSIKSRYASRFLNSFNVSLPLMPSPPSRKSRNRSRSSHISAILTSIESRRIKRTT